MAKPYRPVAQPRETRNGVEIENVRAQKYSVEMVDTCLALVAKYNGYQRVSDIVRDQFGWDIPPRVLSDWKTRAYPMRYQSILIELQPELREQSIARYSDAVTALQTVQDDAIEKVRDSLPSLEPKEAAGALRNISIALGVNTDKHELLDGRPTSRTEAVTADEIIRNLTSKGYAQVVDAEIAHDELEEGTG